MIVVDIIIIYVIKLDINASNIINISTILFSSSIFRSVEIRYKYLNNSNNIDIYIYIYIYCIVLYYIQIQRLVQVTYRSISLSRYQMMG